MEDDATAAAAAAEGAESMVFRLDDLLDQILLSVGFPTTLVRAALVCKRWFSRVSDKKFLRRFRKLNPPRLLGFYIHGYPDHPFLSSECPQRFIPLLPQPTELLATVRTLEGYSFPAGEHDLCVIHHCSNGRVFTSLCDELFGWQMMHQVHSPLCPGTAVISINPRPAFGQMVEGRPNQPPQFGAVVPTRLDVLTREGEDGSLSYFCVFMEPASKEVGRTACVYMAKDGLWRKHTTATPPIPLRRALHSVLIENKVYMTVTLKDISVLDLATSGFSTIQLPHGVQHPNSDFMLSSAPDDSSIYLVELKDFQLHIWMYKEGCWSVVDTFHLLDMCEDLTVSDCSLEDAHTSSPRIKHVGEYAQFVLLQTGQYIRYLDTRWRTLCTLDEMSAEELAMESITIIPFMMIWPPVFRSLRNCDVKK